MRLTLGANAFDLATRALVVGVLERPAAADEGTGPAELCHHARAAAAAGADVVQVAEGADVAALIEALGGTATVAVSFAGEPSPKVVAGAYEAGAALGAPARLSDEFLRLTASASAGVVVAAGPSGGVAGVASAVVEGARRAERAGIPPERIVIEPILSGGLLSHVWRFAVLGYPLLLTVAAESGHEEAGEDSRGTALGAMSLAVIGGCRLLRTEDVRGARRVADVLAAVLAAR